MAWLLGVGLAVALATGLALPEARRPLRVRGYGAKRLATRVALSRPGAWVLARPEVKGVVDWLVRSGRDAGCSVVQLQGFVCLALAVAPVVALVWFGTVVALPMTVAVERIGLGALSGKVERDRRKECEREIPDVLRTLATGIGAGQTLPQAISHVAVRDTGNVSECFAHASMKITCGVAADVALAELQRELPYPGVGMLVMALEVSRTTGAPLEGLLMRSAALVESQASLEQTLSTKTAQVRLSSRVVMFLPCLLVGGLALISSDFRAGLSTPVGAGCLAVAVAMDAVAILAMRRIMAGVAL